MAMTDIERARAERRGSRRGRFAAWSDRARFEFKMWRPQGLLGWCVGAAMLLTPPIFIVISDRMRGRWRDAARVACGGILVIVASFGAEAIALLIGLGGFIARG